MKKIALISIFLLLLIFGCEEQTGDPLGPYPSDVDGIIARFDTLGWRAYDNGEFDLSYARFDSSVKIDAARPLTYIGLGYVNLQLGADDPGRFGMSRSSFSFVSALEGGSPIVEVNNGDVEWGDMTPDSLYFSLGVENDKTPILGVLEPTVSFEPGTGAPSGISVQDLNVLRITENTIVIEPTIYNLPGPDSGDVYIPVSGDIFEVDFAYYNGTMTPVLALAFSGFSQAAQLQGKSDPDELLTSIIYANAVLNEYDEDNPMRADTTVVPGYINDAITSRNVRLLLAQSYFYHGYLYNCMWEIWRLDPSSMGTFNPLSPTFERDLQEKLEDLQI